MPVKTYYADGRTVAMLKRKGFWRSSMPKTRKQYFINGKGAQIRICFEELEVTFLNKIGWPMHTFQSGFSPNDLNTYQQIISK